MLRTGLQFETFKYLKLMFEIMRPFLKNVDIRKKWSLFLIGTKKVKK